MGGEILGLLCVGGFMGTFFLIGVAAVAYYFYARRKASKTYSWPATEGRIEISRVTVSEDWDPDTNTRTISYAPEVRYSYKVNGKDYLGSRIWFGGAPGGSNRRKVEAIVARYPLGSRVTVYYNPEKPAEAVLVRGNPPGGALLLVVGGVFVLGPLCMLFPLLLGLLNR